MTPTVTELLREIALEAAVPVGLRRKALDVLIGLPSEPQQASPVSAAAELCRDVSIHHGAKLAGLRPIDAIKKLRELMPGLSLKDAKDKVDALEMCGRLYLDRKTPYSTNRTTY